MPKLCLGFSQCDDRGYGNGGYRSVYTKSYWNMYGGHNCTNYVAYRLTQRGIAQFTVPGRGNAKYWGEHARAKGYKVDTNPRPGDVAWWYDMGSAGHVAIVESVNLSQGTVVVSEDHWQGNFDWRTYRIDDITGFLHVGGSSSEVESPTVKPAVTAATPKVAGRAEFGAELTATAGSWAPSGVKLSYQWRRDGDAIKGATAAAYELVEADVDAAITVTVTGSKSGYTSVAKTSSATAKVKGLALETTPTPTVSGTSAVGMKLTATPGEWDEGVALAYQWLRDGKDISSATKATYTLAAADKGAKVGVRVTGAKPGYNAIAKTSATVKVAAGVLTATPVPSISGEAKVLKTLTADAGTWAPSGVKFSYQWLRAGKAISKATGKTYVLTSADLGKTISVKVTGAKDGFTSVTTTSEPTAAVAVADVVAAPAAKPSISGTARVGTKLTATSDAWTPSGTSLAYAWLRNGKAIKGATASTYTPTADDLGAALSVAITGSASGFESATVTTAATGKVAPGTLSTTPTPTVSGTAKVLKKLTASPGTWKPSGVKLTYQWLRDGKAISGATKSSYTPSADDQGKRLTVKVTGSKAGYTTASKTSSSTATIAAPDKIKAPSAKPAISGTVRVGSMLTAKSGAWSPSSAAVSYAWLRNGAAIKGATSSTYTLTADDLGASVSVTVTGAQDGYVPASQSSSSTGKVAPGLLSTTPTPTISGTLRVGEKLTAKAGTWKPSGVKLAYVWLRNGVAIEGATSSSYTLTVDDLGAKIGVRVEGSKPGYTAVPKASVVTAPVAIGRFFATPKPKVEGRAAVLATLTADPGVWKPAGVDLSLQWLRDGVDIEGATGPTYVLGEHDLDALISVQVMGTKDGFGPAAVTSDPVKVGPAETVATATPAISGTVQVGKKLTVKAGSWKPSAARLTYVWLRNGSPISGATASSYTPTASDKGAVLSVTVTGTSDGYLPASATSKVTAEVKAGSLSSTPTPKISGTVKVGKKLTATPGTWSPSGVKLSYQWLRDGKTISGATKSTYTLTKSDKGKKITVKVKGTKSGYTTVTKTSKSTAKVA
ncbi:MAG: CHAP domain-containing protein [Arachnia sp.]